MATATFAAEPLAFSYPDFEALNCPPPDATAPTADQTMLPKSELALETLSLSTVEPKSPPPLYSQIPRESLVKVEKDVDQPFASLVASRSSIATYATLQSFIRRPDGPDDDLQALIEKDLDIAFKFFCERLKVNLSSCKEVLQYFKRNAFTIEEMASNLGKLSAVLASHTQEDNGFGLVKPRSFLEAWKGTLQATQDIGSLYSTSTSKTLQICISSLFELHKHSERSRKSCKDNVSKLKRSIEDVQSMVNKTRQKLDAVKEEISKLNNASTNGTTYKPSLFKPSKSNEKTLDELQQRQGSILQVYQDQSMTLESLKDSYFTTHLPAMIKTMKELDSDLSYGIVRYLQLFLTAMSDYFHGASLKVRDPATETNAMAFIAKIQDPQDVLTLYKEFYEASLKDPDAAIGKRSKRSTSNSLSHRKYSDDKAKSPVE